MTDLSSYTDDDLLGMLQQQTNAAYNDQTTPQITGASRLPLMAGSSLSAGLGRTISTPGDLAQLYDAYIGAPTGRAVSTLLSTISPNLGTAQPLDFGKVDPTVSKQLQTLFPTSPQVSSDLTSAGITNRPDLQPQTTGEKYLAAGARGVGGVIPQMLMGDLPLALNTAMQGGTSEIGDEAASNLFPDNKGIQIATSLAGGLAGGGAANTATKTVNAVKGNGSNILQAYQDAGITPNLVGDVSGSPFMKTLQTAGGKEASQQSLDQFGQSVEKLANGFGSSATLQEAGTFAQNDAEKWLKNANTIDSQNWNNVNQKIGSTAPVPTTNTVNTLESIQSKAGDNDAAKAFLTSDIGKTVGNIVKNSPTNDFDWLSGSRNTGYEPLQWQTAAALRSRIGEYLSNPTSILDAGHSQAATLYGALTQDMQSTALANGPDALSAFQQANTFTSQKHDFVDSVLNNITNKDPEKAASSLLSSAATGGTQLQALRQQMPATADQLAAVSLRRMGAGESQGAAGNAVSPSRWLSNSDPTRRMSPEANQALFNTPEAQQKIGALDTVSNAMRDTEKFANSPKTASHNALYATLVGVPTEAAAGYHAFGTPGAAFGAISGLAPLGVRPLAGALTNNETIARFMAANKPATKAGATLAQAALQQSSPFSWNPSFSGGQ